MQKHAQRLGLVLADERRITIATAQSDVGADRTEHAGKRIWPLPSRRERRDRAAARSADGAIIAGSRKSDRATVGRFPRFDRGQHFFENKPRVSVAEAIVFVASIEAIQRVRRIRRFHDARSHKHADQYRDFPAGDEVVEDGRRVPLHAVLVHVHAGGLGAVVLARHVDRDFPRGAGKNLGARMLKLDELALRHAGLRLGIGARQVILGRVKRQRGDTEESKNERETQQGFHEG